MNDQHPYPVLKDLLGPQLDAMERIVARGRAGKHAADDLLAHGSEWHFNKADSHQIRAGTHYTERDHETGEPHLLHSAIRLMMADACARSEVDG